MRFERGTMRAVAALAASVTWACAEPPGRWSGTAWWATYAELPEIELTPVSGGALDETTRPFPAVRRVSVSAEGRIAVVQEGVPAVWVYDERGRSRGRVGRSEIMDLRGPGRTSVWARAAGWLSDESVWVAERGGSVAVFNHALAFSDVWEPSASGDPVAVFRRGGGLVALARSADGSGSVLRSVTRTGLVREVAAAAPGDTLVPCADGTCFVALEARPGDPGYDVTLRSIGGPEEGPPFALPAAPDGAREDEVAPLPRPVRDLLVDDERRVWVGLVLDGSDRAYWLILDPSGAPIGRFHLTGGQRGILVEDGVFWARRDGDGVTWLHRYAVGFP